jgi:hypothetical protein
MTMPKSKKSRTASGFVEEDKEHIHNFGGKPLGKLPLDRLR